MQASAKYSWLTRDLCTTAEEAIEALADLSRTYCGVFITGSTRQKENLFDDAKRFAEIWQIPFSWTALEAAAKTYRDPNDYYDDSYGSYDGWVPSEEC